MSIQKFLIFSGFDSKYVEKTKPSLKANQIIPIYRKLIPESWPKYFQQLSSEVELVTRQAIFAEGKEAICFLASCVNNAEISAVENEYFFPAMRKLAFANDFRADISKINLFIAKCLDAFNSEDTLKLKRQVKSWNKATLRLPPQNVDIKQFKNCLRSLYEMDSAEPSDNLCKYIQMRNGNRKLRVNGVDFEGVVNGPMHPIRRCTDSHKCDVHARFRLGFNVQDRFEFGVSCEKGFNGKSFKRCDGIGYLVPNEATHLNMRVNDDFEIGK